MAALGRGLTGPSCKGALKKAWSDCDWSGSWSDRAFLQGESKEGCGRVLTGCWWAAVGDWTACG
eukprot:4303382-Lingulodinium_polyedra.AAC.1